MTHNRDPKRSITFPYEILNYSTFGVLFYSVIKQNMVKHAVTSNICMSYVCIVYHIHCTYLYCMYFYMMWDGKPPTSQHAPNLRKQNSKYSRQQHHVHNFTKLMVICSYVTIYHVHYVARSMYCSLFSSSGSRIFLKSAIQYTYYIF